MAKQKMDVQKKKCITPNFKVSFPQVFEPKAFEDQAPKYSITMLFDKKTDLKELKRAANNAIIEEYGSLKDVPKKFKMPFRDGSEREDTPGYKGTIFVIATSKNKPGLVDGSLQPIISQDDFYAGCYARAELIAFCYDVSGNRGVSFALQNLQKMKDGERFGGRKAAEDVFDAVEGSDDEDVSDEEESSDDEDDGF